MIKNIIKTNRFLSVTLDDGTVLVSTNTSKTMMDAIKAANTDEEIISLICPEEETDEHVVSKDVIDAAKGEFESDYVEFRGNSAYIPSISELTVPQDFVEAIIKAEKELDEDKLQAYLNFWTLVSLNPDSRVRNNLFWFIKKWNIKICKNGLIVTYRNANYKKDGKYGLYATERITGDWVKIKGQKRSPKRYTYDYLDENGMPTEESKLVKQENVLVTLDDLYKKISETTEDKTVFTDQHTGTFTIKLGEPVSMPREDCDNDQSHECSRGLHQASAQWLEHNYYGDTGLVCLVNPANVVAIPCVNTEYGKMRVCEYLPIAIAQYGEDGHVVEDIDETGFDLGDKYLVDYSGKVNNEDLDNYTLTFARTVGIDRASIANKIFRMAESQQQVF